MTENNEEQAEGRTVTTRDIMNGEELEIVHFPQTGVITVNGDTVTRAPALENEEGQTVFHRAPDNRLFTVETESLSGLHF